MTLLIHERNKSEYLLLKNGAIPELIYTYNYHRGQRITIV